MNWDEPIIDASLSDTGMRRSNNQDSCTVVRAKSAELWRQRGHLFMVADGMGAHAVGELASKLACDNIPHSYMKTRTGSSREAIVKAYRDVGQVIHSKAALNRDFDGMGTTASTLILLPEGALIAHVGDSRVYRVRGARIDQLTFDHSLVWELVRRNHMTHEQASKSVPRNVITRSLGPDPTVEVDIEGPVPVQPGDVFVLCSDGLSGPVQDDEIGAFAANFHPKDAAEYMLHLANLRGGHDNITVVVIRVGAWVDPDAPEASDTPGSASAPDRKAGFSFRQMLGGWGRKSNAEVVEKEPYTSCECPVDDELLDRISELARNVQAVAVEQAWQADWPSVTGSRKSADRERAGGNPRLALKNLGEAVVKLGIAGRLHRREHGPVSSR